MTGATRCPRFAATSPIAPWSCRPKPARDAATPGPPPDASAAARARRLDALRARLAVDGAPVCCGAGAGNPGRTRTGARAPSRRPRTTSDTPYTEPAPWQRLPSAPLHRAGPLPGAPPRPPWITIAPPEATTSAGAVGHDRAVGWITSRAPLKQRSRLLASRTRRSRGNEGKTACAVAPDAKFSAALAASRACARTYAPSA